MWKWGIANHPPQLVKEKVVKFCACVTSVCLFEQKKIHNEKSKK